MDALDITKVARKLIARHRAARERPKQMWAASETQSRTALTNKVRAARAELDDKVLLILVCAPANAPLVDIDGVRVVQLPPKVFRTFHPKTPRRYRVLKGGRGSAKSWGIVRVLILRALAADERILCAREFQKSIAESSHKLLSSQIEALGFSSFFDVKTTSISCSFGSEFLFEGLHANIGKIKSLEGVTICWLEEAAKISAASWDVLIPTIRAPRSEIWCSYNPEDQDDPTHQRFAVNPPPDAAVEPRRPLQNPPPVARSNSPT